MTCNLDQKGKGMFAWMHWLHCWCLCSPNLTILHPESFAIFLWNFYWSMEEQLIHVHGSLQSSSVQLLDGIIYLPHHHLARTRYWYGLQGKRERLCFSSDNKVQGCSIGWHAHQGKGWQVHGLQVSLKWSSEPMRRTLPASYFHCMLFQLRFLVSLLAQLKSMVL